MKVRLELSMPVKFKNEPVFYYIIKNFEVIPNIIEASFSTEMGWAIVDFDGDKKEIERLVKFLEEKGVQVQKR